MTVYTISDLAAAIQENVVNISSTTATPPDTAVSVPLGNGKRLNIRWPWLVAALAVVVLLLVLTRRNK